jgi:hypothetical protein
LHDEWRWGEIGDLAAGVSGRASTVSVFVDGGLAAHLQQPSKKVSTHLSRTTNSPADAQLVAGGGNIDPPGSTSVHTRALASPHLSPSAPTNASTSLTTASGDSTKRLKSTTSRLTAAAGGVGPPWGRAGGDGRGGARWAGRPTTTDGTGVVCNVKAGAVPLGRLPVPV